jgi:hypothetical protein
MHITENFLIKLLNFNVKKEEENYDAGNETEKNIINIFNFSINKISIEKTIFLNLEYLTLNNTQLKDISFIKYFPFLWYLDIRNNFVNIFQ